MVSVVWEELQVVRARPNYQRRKAQLGSCEKPSIRDGLLCLHKNGRTELLSAPVRTNQRFAAYETSSARYAGRCVGRTISSLVIPAAAAAASLTMAVAAAEVAAAPSSNEARDTTTSVPAAHCTAN
jgi:hypothetical protein